MIDYSGMIVIVTYGRSGSTLLQRIIQTIPNSCIRGENYATLFSLFQAAKRAKRSKEEFTYLASKSGHPWFGADKIRHAFFEQQLCEAFISSVLVPPNLVSWLGFKEIRFQECGDEFEPYLDFIRRNFRNCQFVFNKRNLEDVARSAWFRNLDADKVKYNLGKLETKFDKYILDNPEFCFMCQHEQTVLDPTYIREFFDRINVEWRACEVQNILQEKLTH